MKEFNEKGCEVCRQRWLSGDFPREVAISLERHAHLHLCDECGTFWEQFERFPDVIKIEDVRKYYEISDELLEYARQRQNGEK